MQAEYSRMAYSLFGDKRSNSVVACGKNSHIGNRNTRWNDVLIIQILKRYTLVDVLTLVSSMFANHKPFCLSVQGELVSR